ncbi:MAG: ABC transporter permease subunit [Clostridiaceae bacterium]
MGQTRALHSAGNKSRMSVVSSFIKDVGCNRALYIMLIPVILYYVVFRYAPMYGTIIAFKDFSPGKGILGSPWAGLAHFKDFITGYYFSRTVINTVLISLYDLIFSFPAPIILALMLNEIRNNIFKRTIQTITYMPHFVSLVVICGIILEFTATDGVINDFLVFFGAERTSLMQRPDLFRTIYIVSGIWQQVGWGTIIYLAAISGIDMELYEACTIDGGGRLRQLIHITLPGISSTIVILLILRMGSIMNVGFEKIILLYSPATYQTADVISSFVYRKGLQEFSFSYSAAVGLFNSAVDFFLVISANWISRKVNETSLW